MKQVSSTLVNEIRTAYNLYAVPRLTVDWNWNRYTEPTADNFPDEDDAGFDIEAFPIESIYSTDRPSTKGICKALIGQSIVANGYHQPTDPKFYVGDSADIYQYWTSPFPTDSNGNFQSYNDGTISGTVVNPHINYPTPVLTNKILIRIENTWASPKSYNVQIQTTVGGTWKTIGGTSPTMDNASGILTLYYNGTAWVTTRPTTLVATSIAGIMFQVASMKGGYDLSGNPTTYRAPKTNVVTNTDGTNSNFNLIAIEAHYEADLSSRVINTSVDFEMSEESELYPIGTVTANTGSITLSNDDGIFNADNTSSPYYGLIDSNAVFNLEYVYTIGSSTYSVQEFKMFSNDWSPSSDGTIAIDLTDGSKFLDAVKPRQLMYTNKSTNELIWRVLDSVGFIDYEIQLEDEVTDHVIPVFWTTGQDTVWAVLDTLAEATQTAIYFDSFGKLQVRTRESAFMRYSNPSWNLLAVPSGTSLPDIIELTPNNETVNNSIDVTYKTTSWKTLGDGSPALSKVWEPDGDTVVRSAALKSSMSTTSTSIYLDQNETAVWPYTSKVQIDGEVIEYNGKQYVYYTGTNGNTANTVWLTSADDLATYLAKTPYDYQGKNYFTGALKVTARGLWNSDVRAHNVDSNGWNQEMEINSSSGGMTNNPSGYTLNKGKSTVTINTPGQMKDDSDVFWSTYGTSNSTGYYEYGTAMTFNKDTASTTQRAGMAFKLSGAEENGYYVELCLTNSLTATDRNTRNEVTLYSRNGAKGWTPIKSQQVGITTSIQYEIDAYVDSSGAQDTISVWLNGQKMFIATTTNATKHSDSGRIALYARGRTNVTYEYAYGIANIPREPDDDFGFYDLHYGGIRGDEWQREHVWETRTRWKKIKKKKQKKIQIQHNNYIFDEFGPYVHEVREFSVVFDPSPVNYSYLFSTNSGNAACVEYSSTPYTADFIIANTARSYAILEGADAVDGVDNPINEIFTVLGQDLNIADDQTITVTNDQSIRTNGLVSTELTSDWIQSQSMAQDLADWMSTHWSSGVDNISVQIFGNPLIELGDIVDINYPQFNMSPDTHRYFVIGIENTFDTGLSTTLTLRRAV
jgi:hypothetical protein